MLTELQTWAKLNGLTRNLRCQAKNILDTRWMFKWNRRTVDVTRSEDRQVEVASSRQIRARLTACGFKDSATGDIDRYAGTSSMCSHRVLVSETVRQGWDICTIDIGKAFMQRATYEELAALAGEPAREMNFTFPPQPYLCYALYQALRRLIHRWRCSTVSTPFPG